MAATVYQMLAETAHRQPGSIALVFEDRATNYAEFLRSIDNVACHLAAAGIASGDAFAVYAQNCPEILACYYAAARLGTVMVPINPNMTGAEVSQAVAHGDAKLLIHDDSGSEAASRAMPVERRRLIASLDEVCEHPATDAPSHVRGEDDFVIIYTSGSTGTPKAIVLNHRAQVDVLDALGEMWGLSDRDTTVVALPLGYLYGLSTASAAGFRSGGKVVVLDRFHPATLLDALISMRATVFHGVPTMYAMMLEYAEQRGLTFDLSHMRLLICAGAPLADELRKRFAQRFGMEIQNYYALSECTPVFGVYASDSITVPSGAIGKLAPLAQVRIVDSEGRDCPPGIPGELLVRGAATMTRYHKDPETTDRSFVDGLFRTGDVACRDAAGFYAITGRMKDIIIRGGANISPSEVESVLNRHPGIHDVAVIGVADKIFGEVPVAFAVKRGGVMVTADDLIAMGERELASFKVPRTITFIEELPRGKTGKVDRNELKVLWAQRRA